MNMYTLPHVLNEIYKESFYEDGVCYQYNHAWIVQSEAPENISYHLVVKK
jgi:hypothetical protein